MKKFTVGEIISDESELFEVKWFIKIDPTKKMDCVEDIKRQINKEFDVWLARKKEEEKVL